MKQWVVGGDFFCRTGYPSIGRFANQDPEPPVLPLGCFCFYLFTFLTVAIFSSSKFWRIWLNSRVPVSTFLRLYMGRKLPNFLAQAEFSEIVYLKTKTQKGPHSIRRKSELKEDWEKETMLNV